MNFYCECGCFNCDTKYGQVLRCRNCGKTIPAPDTSKSRAKLKGITYKARTVRPEQSLTETVSNDLTRGNSTLPACYGQPDCRCMHCQQSRDYLDRIIMRNG